MKNKTKKRLIIAVVIIGAIVSLYFLFTLIFLSRFAFGTQINGISAGHCTTEAICEKLADAVKEYSIAIKQDGNVKDTIKGTDIGLRSDIDKAEIESMLRGQNPFLWPLKIFSPDQFISNKVVSLDASKLEKVVNDLNVLKNKDFIKTENAYVHFEDGAFRVKEEVYGTELTPEDLRAKLFNNISLLKREVDLEKDGLYLEPEIVSTSPQFKDLLSKLNRTINVSISYIEGTTVPREEIASWISISGDYEMTVDGELVKGYVRGLSAKHNTAGKPKTLLNSYGETVTVPGGNYGWIVDIDKETEHLMADVDAGQSVNRELEYKYTANSHDENDYGNSYVEVNLTTQHLFLYKDGELILDTPFVSGDVSKNRITHTGAYRIAYKQSPAVLRGVGYATPVTYWMPFNNGEGLHDANWRSNFGGNIYRTNGSHGCVNLPPSVAKKIYENVTAGYPVLVYQSGRANDKSVVQPAVTQEAVTIQPVPSAPVAPNAEPQPAPAVPDNTIPENPDIQPVVPPTPAEQEPIITDYPQEIEVIIPEYNPDVNIFNTPQGEL